MSATIITLHDPAGINRHEVESIECGEKLFDFLINKYGKNGFSVPTVIYDGEIKEESTINLNDHMGDGYIVKDEQIIYIVHCPQGIAEVIVAVIVAVIIAIALIPEIDEPEFSTAKESPNNNITGQTNIARPLERIPDLYGKNKVYPDLIARSYFEYIGNVKFQTEYLCIGRGSYLVENIKSGDTLISAISGATATVYEPYTRPPVLYDIEESNEVNGQEIKAPDDRVFTFLSAPASFTANNRITSASSKFSDFTKLTAGDTFNISGSSYPGSQVTGVSNISFSGDTISSTGPNLSVFSAGEIIGITGTVSNNVSVEVNTASASSITCYIVGTTTPYSFTTESNTSATLDSSFDNDGTYTFSSLTVTPTISDPDSPNTYDVYTTETTIRTLASQTIDCYAIALAGNEVGYFVLPGTPDEAWLDYKFPSGLKGENGAYSIQITQRLQQIDAFGADVGSPVDTIVIYSGNTYDELNYTEKLTIPVPGEKYKCKVIRNTNRVSGINTRDDIKITRMAGAEEVTATDFGDITSVFVVTKATDQATSLQERKFNAVCTRKLITYDYDAGQMTSSESATAKFADAVVHMITDQYMGNKSTSVIDLEELYAIQSEIENDPIYGDDLGRFCYSFSNKQVPVLNELKTICNAARVFFYRKGNKFHFTRDEAQPIRTGLFNRRNKKPDSERKNINIFKDGDHDGVRLEWIDQETGDGEVILFPEDNSAVNPRSVKAAGIKNYNQAWNRGYYEYLKLRDQNTHVEITVTRIGLIVDLNARVANIDGTNIKTQDGEVISISEDPAGIGTVVETSELIDFEGNATATVIFTAENGDITTPVLVSPRTDGGKGFILSENPLHPIFVKGHNENQLGTLYSFASDSNHNKSDYLVQEIHPMDNGYIKLKLLNYAESIYLPDITTPTPRPL